MTTREVEIAEARGFFMGEGHLCVAKSEGSSWKTEARVLLRDDDAAVLYWFKDLFGGVVRFYRRNTALAPNANPQAAWLLNRYHDLLVFCDAMASGRIPAKKSRELALFRSAVLLRWSPGRKLTRDEHAELERIRQHVMGLRKYKAQPREIPKSRQMSLLGSHGG